MNGEGVSVTILPGGTSTAIPVTITVGDGPLGSRLGNVTTPTGTSMSFMTQFIVAPRLGRWTLVEPIIWFRSVHASTLLPDGRVLVSGGGHINDEIYNPAAGTWTLTNALNTRRAGHSANLLANGKVLAAAGTNLNCCPAQPLASAELYDSVNGVWTVTGTLNQKRSSHTATLLADGRVLVVGGWDENSNALNTTELYDPATGQWSASGSMNYPRAEHRSTRLQNGKVLVTGGMAASSTYRSTSVAGSPGGLWPHRACSRRRRRIDRRLRL